MGLGVGIVASMAADCADRKDLQVVEAEELFPRSTTWIGFRKDSVLRRYMFDFLQLFAPHVTPAHIKEVRDARSQVEINRLFADTDLPVRGGCADGVTEAA